MHSFQVVLGCLETQSADITHIAAAAFQVVLGCLSTQSADITHIAAATFNHHQNATLLNVDSGSF